MKTALATVLTALVLVTVSAPVAEASPSPSFRDSSWGCGGAC